MGVKSMTNVPLELMRVIPMEISGLCGQVFITIENKKWRENGNWKNPFGRKCLISFCFEMLHTILEPELSLAFAKSI